MCRNLGGEKRPRNEESVWFCSNYPLRNESAWVWNYFSLFWNCPMRIEVSAVSSDCTVERNHMLWSLSIRVVRSQFHHPLFMELAWTFSSALYYSTLASSCWTTYSRMCTERECKLNNQDWFGCGVPDPASSATAGWRRRAQAASYRGELSPITNKFNIIVAQWDTYQILVKRDRTPVTSKHLCHAPSTSPPAPPTRGDGHRRTR
jgi:hypothetical protein